MAPVLPRRSCEHGENWARLHVSQVTGRFTKHDTTGTPAQSIFWIAWLVDTLACTGNWGAPELVPVPEKYSFAGFRVNSPALSDASDEMLAARVLPASESSLEQRGPADAIALVTLRRCEDDSAAAAPVLSNGDAPLCSGDSTSLLLIFCSLRSQNYCGAHIYFQN